MNELLSLKIRSKIICLREIKRPAKISLFFSHSEERILASYLLAQCHWVDAELCFITITEMKVFFSHFSETDSVLGQDQVVMW